MRSVLGAIWERVDCEPSLFHAEEVQEWPPGVLEQWVECGLLRPTTPASTMRCGVCGRQHAVKVVFLSGADDMQAYIPCHMCGPSQIDPDWLRRWEHDLGALTRFLSTELVCRGSIVELAPQRLWRLGTASCAGRHHNVFFGRMLGGHDGGELLRQQNISKRGIVFVPSMMPNMSLMDEDSRPFVFSLRETVVSSGGALHLVKAIVESQVADRRNEEAAKQNLPSKNAWRVTLIAELTEAMIEHIRSARDYAHVSKQQTGSPKLLPRPTQRQLARQLGVSQASVYRCLTDPAARDLQYLWEMAVDLDRIMHNG